MVENLLSTGRLPTLTELVVGGIDLGLDTVNMLGHALTGNDIGLADDGNGYADAPQQIVPGQDGAPDLRDPTSRSEERRVGKEGRCGWAGGQAENRKQERE